MQPILLEEEKNHPSPFFSRFGMSAATFQELFNEALGDDIVMRLLQENAQFAVYVGLWSTWGDHTTAKVLLVTALKTEDTPAPPGPLVLGDLVWVVLQLQTVDQENPAWPSIAAVLRSELTPPPAQSATQRNANRLQYDPSDENVQTKQIADPNRLSQVQLLQESEDGRGDKTPSVARPGPTLTRKRVGYSLPNYNYVRVYIEKPTTKQLLQQKLNGNAGLTREASLLAAVNEWRTWIIMDDVVM